MSRINIEKNWLALVAIILVPIIFWSTVYDILDDPKDNEKFAILFIGDGLDCEALQNYITENLSDPRMKSITVETTVVYESLYYDYLKTRCYDYDLIILTESSMRDQVGRVVFEREIMLKDYAEILPKSDFYYENINETDIPFGFVLWDEGSDNLFSEFYSGKEKCYLFLSPRSVNLDRVNGEGVKGDDYALTVLNALFK